MPRSLPFSSAMTDWRSSRFLPATRTCFSWIDACTRIFESLISRTISLAFSIGMPSWSVIVWRSVLPAAGSGSPMVSALRSMPRRWSFDWRMSSTALSFMSSGDFIVITIFSSVISFFVPFRS